MPWFYVDDGFTHSKPVMNLPDRHRLAAVGLWTLAGAWSAHEETDGAVPTAQLRAMGSTPAVVRALTDPGPMDAALWERTAHGILFKGWSKWQKTREENEAKRVAEAARKRAWREANPGKEQTRSDKGRTVPASTIGGMSHRDTIGTDSGTDGGCPGGTDAGRLTRAGARTRPDPTRPDPSLVVTSGGEVTEVDARECNGADAPPPPDLTDSGKTQNGSAPVCAKHPDGPDHDEPCVPCGRVRKYRDALGAVNGVKQPQAVTEAEQRRIQRDREDHERRMAIRRCPDCDSEGNLDWRANGGTVFPCPHDSRLYREVHDAYVADMQERHASWEAWNARQQQENQERIAALAEIGREASHG